MSSLEEAVTQVTQFLGMHPCDRSDRIPEGKSAHTLYLAGKTVLLSSVRTVLSLSLYINVHLSLYNHAILNMILLNLSRKGTYRGGHEVLVRAKLALSDGVTMQLTVRSDDPGVSEVIASAVG